jgi:two-component sensor histidine kinase
VQVLQAQSAGAPDPAEVGRARRWARARLSGSGYEPDSALAETLVLVVSELVTNAVVHTGRPAVLRLLFPLAGEPGGSAEMALPPAPVRIEVADASDSAPCPRHAGGGETNGRGLDLVQVLCDRWGWYPDGAGKRVWCEIDPADSAVPAPAQPVSA